MNEWLDWPLTLLAVSVVWLFYMDMPLRTLLGALTLISIGWWIRGHVK